MERRLFLSAFIKDIHKDVSVESAADLDVEDPVCGAQPGEESQAPWEDGPGGPVAQCVHRAEGDVGLGHPGAHRVPGQGSEQGF